MVKFSVRLVVRGGVEVVVAEGALFVEAAPAPEEDYLPGVFFSDEAIPKHGMLCLRSFVLGCPRQDGFELPETF